MGGWVGAGGAPSEGVSPTLSAVPVFPLPGPELPGGGGSHEQTERAEDRFVPDLQRRPLDDALSLQGHAGADAEGVGRAAWTVHGREGEAPRRFDTPKFRGEKGRSLPARGQPDPPACRFSCPQSRSRCRRSRARRGNTSRRACATGPAAAGSPCSPTAGVRRVSGGGGGPPVPQMTPLTFHPPPADDNATIRVTNLSEDTRETDLQELFRPFGSISRIYLAKDKTTGQSKVGVGGFPSLWGSCGENPPLPLTLSLSLLPGFRLHQLPPPRGRSAGDRRRLRFWLRPLDPQRGMGQVSAGGAAWGIFWGAGGACVQPPLSLPRSSSSADPPPTESGGAGSWQSAVGALE